MMNMYILDILKRYTDAEHTMEQKDIVERLRSDYGMTVDRKAVKANLMELADFDDHIDYMETERYKKDGTVEQLTTGWHYSHEFEDAELRMLIDSILFSKAIPEKQSEKLIAKISGLSNVYFKNKVKHVSSLPALEHTSNKNTIYNFDVIDDAITEGKQISFTYNDYGADKQLHPRRERPYIVNPYQMVANDGRYYLVCNYDNHDNLANIRIDKMTGIELLQTPAKAKELVKGMEHGLNLPKHMAEHIYMFSDEPVTIVLRVLKRNISDIVEWFGKGFAVIDEDIARRYQDFYETDEDVLYVRLTCSKAAMSHWAMQYGDSVEVIYPHELRETLAEKTERMYRKYNPSNPLS